MLTLTIPSIELFDERTSEFSYTKPQTLQLEHSLVSVSKWEAMYNKSFFKEENKSSKETLDYIKCMTITQNVDDKVYSYIPKDVLNLIDAYVEAPMTATILPDEGNTKTKKETITSELIYYWMIASEIPLECQKWHLNRLITLIRVCSLKNSPPKKMSKSEIFARNKALNEQRKTALKTKG